MFALDTNVASELMRPEPTPAVAAWIAERDAQEMYLTAVSEAELRYGVAIMPAGKRRNALEAAMTRWLDQGFRERGFFRSTAPQPEPTRRSRPSVAKRVGRSARPTARLRPYAVPVVRSWSRGTCGISAARESTLSILGRLQRIDGCCRFVSTRLRKSTG